MRRTKNLENVCYRKKYKDIYRILFTADLDTISDHSTWHKSNPDYVERNRPLWIIAESSILNKRIWITQDWGDLEITTAQLDLACNSIAYSESFRHIPCKNQKEMAAVLEELLQPCLRENIEECEEEEL